MIKKTLLAATLALALASTQTLPALAEFPGNWYVEGVQDLLSGNVVSTAIKADGSLVLSAELKSLGRLKEAGIMDAARLHDGRLVVATNQEGAVYLVEAGKEPTALLKLGRDLVTAVSVDAQDRIYAAAAPGGRLYAGTAKDGLKLVYKGNEGYIWDILTTPDGHTYFVTGNGGALYELKGDKAELLFKAQESNLRRLYYDSKWGLLIGGGSRGVVYRYLGNQHMEALLEVAGAEDVTALTGDGKGHLFVGINRSLAGKDQSKSAVFHVNPAGHSELLFPVDGETVFSLALDAAGTLFVGTGGTGRIYTIEHPLVSDSRTLSLPARSLASQVTALVPAPDKSMLVFGSGPATIESYQSTYRSAGVYESQILNTALPSIWGMLHVNAVIPPGTEIVAWSRSGNTQTPDQTWSPWSKPYSDPEEARIESPRGRFLQLKFELRTHDEKVTPSLHSFEISYLRDNLEPSVNAVFFLQRGIFFTPHTVGALEGPRSLEITPQVLAKLQLPHNSAELYAELLSEKTAPPMRMAQKFRPGMLTVAWDAGDPNEDELRYEVFYQSYGQDSWKPLARNLNQPVYSFDTSALADGLYHFRVYASDALTNPGNGYRVYRDSDLILIDNTPPEIHNLNAQVSGQQVEVSFDAEDQYSQLAYAEYAVDAQTGELLEPDDKIVDSRKEHFSFKLPPQAKGEHVVAIKLSDRLGNLMTAKTRFEVK